MLTNTLCQIHQSVGMSTTDYLAAWALGISILSVITSLLSYWHSNELAKRTFDTSYRPYVTGSGNYQVPDANGKPQVFVHTVNISVINAPAKISDISISYFERIDGIPDQLIYADPPYKNNIMYPGAGVLLINAEASDINRENAFIIANKGGQLIRKVRIDYEWISDKPIKHFYESEWHFHFPDMNLPETGFWNPIYQNAN